MSPRRALVVHTRMPAFDRDSGSQDVDNAVNFLLESGWSVTFLAQEESGDTEERHAQRLRHMGVATYAGFGWAERVLTSGQFDLALIAFWEPASKLIPLIREHSPDTRVIVNSMDVHFLRHARRSFGQSADLGDIFGSDTVRELNTYNRADAIIAVADKERELLGDFLGPERVFTLPLAEHVERSSYALSDRRGMYFVANFRHLPNREAVEYLCGEVLPLLDPDLLGEHPLTVVGNWLAEAKLDLDRQMPGLHLVGWVPSVVPYVERSRIAVVPLLHGAGVKRKVLQSMMAGTPVVTTPVGAESLDLVQGEHALIGADAADLAAGITRLLTNDVLWQRIATNGANHVDARHHKEVVRRRFDGIVEQVMSRPLWARAIPEVEGREAVGSGLDRGHTDAIRRRIRTTCEPGEVVLVASQGDQSLSDLGSQPSWPFPQNADGDWAGFDPVDGPAAINHLEMQRTRGARYFVLPNASFSWRYRYPELHDHLEHDYRRVHQDEHFVMYDLAPADQAIALDPPTATRVAVLGTYAATRTGPPPSLVAELGASERLQIDQQWRPGPSGDAWPTAEPTDADFTVHVRDDAILPSRFLDELIATQTTLDVDRLQPTHTAGPAAGPPVTERHRGTIGREVDAVTALPVLSVRAGAAVDGPVTLTDSLTVGLRGEGIATRAGASRSDVRRVWVADEDHRPACYERPEPDQPPRISVLIATYQRADLLHDCLTHFAKQTLDRSEYEVVVVDDGSEPSTIDAAVGELADQIQLVGVRIEHAGRSAAKNLAVLLARAPLVLFFDDDDRPSPDYLERHVLAHEQHRSDAVAILGHTDWAPELEITPLMHFVTDVDRLMFAYERLGDGQVLDWRGFWEGRLSCKRSLLVSHGLHDQRINYSIDVEMGWRLAPLGLRVIYDASAVSVMARPLDTNGFCRRTEAKGRAHAVIAALHPGTEVAQAFGVDEAVSYWQEHGANAAELRRRVATLEQMATTDEAVVPELHASYRKLLRILHAKGAAEAASGMSDTEQPPPEGPEPSDLEHTRAGLPATVQPFENTDPDLVYDASPPGASSTPQLTISIPVWSRTPELAAMARSTIERIWEVARIPTEVVVVDNGSPHDARFAAKVHRYPENKGVATGWNTGIRLSSAPVVVVLNSDCRVEPGWDEALYEAALDGRRVAFPYTDHCDGLGFVRPDQGGTAGWCFMMSKAIYEEVGVFDEWFNPAFCEDTDYWHRAWALGIELTPVPAARVVHARRTTASTTANVDWLLQGHRYKYGWKHGVDPLRAPPYYNREIVEYHGSFDPPQSS